MSVVQQVLRDTTVRVWSASGDSRVGIVAEFPTPEGVRKRFAVHLLNQPNLKPLVLLGDDLEAQWLLAPRIDVRWMNVGSQWVRNDEHKNWKLPVAADLRYEVYEPLSGNGYVRIRRHHKKVGKDAYTYFSQTCFTVMNQFTRLWGAETPKGTVPTEPLAFLARKLPGRPKKEKPGPKRALDRLLERDLISE